MKPGEIIVKEADIEINPGKEVITIKVENAGDRPVQVGSHYHFFELQSQRLYLVEILLFFHDQNSGPDLLRKSGNENPPEQVDPQHFPL